MENDTNIEQNNRTYTSVLSQNNEQKMQFSGLLGGLSCIGLFITIISCFLKFAPITDLSWFTMGTGKLIVLFSVIGLFLNIKKEYFGSFFITIFLSFFIIHEIIICYDSYAIALGKECGEDGTFRLVFDLFKDAYNPNCGSLWATLGSVSSFILVTLAWIFKTIELNQEAKK